jgi:hypothetical protein
MSNVDVPAQLAQQVFCCNQCIVSDIFVMKEKWSHLVELTNRSEDDHFVKLASDG